MRKIIALGVAIAALSVATPTMASIDTSAAASATASDTRTLVPRAANSIRTLLVAQGAPTDPKCPKNYYLENNPSRTIVAADCP